VPALQVLTNYDAFVQVWSHCDQDAKYLLTGQEWYNMFCCSEVCPFIAKFDAAQLILINFVVLSLNLLRMPFDAKDWQILHNTASNGPVWPHLGNSDHVWSRIWTMNYLVHIEAEVRNLGIRHQIMAGMALWGKFQQIWPKVAYNGPIYVLVAGFDKFWLY